MSLVTNGVFTPTGGRSPAAPQCSEDYYALAHWLRAGGMSAVAPHTVGVTACTRGAGVTTVAENLARAVAEACENPVLLLDLSSRSHVRPSRPSGHASGVGAKRITEIARPTLVPNLYILRSTELDDADRLEFDPAAIHGLMRSLDEAFGYVVVDLPTTDSSLCCQAAGVLNGILLVIEAERTRFEAAARAKNRLIHGHANVLGIVLNNHPQHLPKWLDARL